MTRFGLLAGLMICWPSLLIAADSPAGKDTTAQLRTLDGNVLSRDDDEAKERAQMLARDVRGRLQAASVRENRAWQQVKDRASGDKFRDARLHALRVSLGQFPVGPASRLSVPPAVPRMRVTRTLKGDDYRIENLVYETPGLVATANLYTSAKPEGFWSGQRAANRGSSPAAIESVARFGVKELCHQVGPSLSGKQDHA